MPRDVRIIDIFLASPGNTEDERKAIVELVEQLNLERGRDSGYLFEVMRWETHSFPDLGIDGQDVINQQMGNDYDVFLGIMKGRFGTPTGRSGSGTEEEYERALARVNNEDGAKHILFYFGSEPIMSSDITDEYIEQYQKVKSFKKRLHNDGLLTGEFENIDIFVQSVRLNLTRIRSGYEKETLGSKESSRSALPANTVKPASNQSETDEGYLDLVEIVSSQFENGVRPLNEIGAAVEKLGAALERRGNELSDLPPNDVKSASAIMVATADDMLQYADCVQSNIEEYANNFNKGLENLTRAFEIYLVGEIQPAQVKDAKDGLDTAMSLLATLDEVIPTIEGLTKAINDIPRAKSELNKAKRRTLEVQRTVASILDESRSLLREMYDLINRQLGENANLISELEATEE